MALVPVLTLIQTQQASRPRALYLGGMDVVSQGTANGYGTPIDSVEVNEVGPGAVSSMSFTINDPGKSITITDGMDVRFVDATNNVPIFTGWVQSWSIRSDFGTIGRTYTVECAGPESLLDWSILTADLVILTGTTLRDAVQAAASAAVGTGPLRAFSSASAINSSQAAPIAGTSNSVTILSTITLTAGTTLRECIRQLSAQTIGAAGYGYSQAAMWVATVDFWYGLRLYPDDPTGSVASDYVSFAITAGSAGNLSPASLDYETESNPVRGVYVKGTGASVTVMDGSGLPGQIAYINDTTLTTTAMVTAAAVAYLTQYGVNIRGSFTLESVLPSQYNSVAAQVHPGSGVDLTDASVALNGTTRKIYTIRKTFTGDNREFWTMTFGGLAPSAMNELRRLTRSTLN